MNARMTSAVLAASLAFAPVAGIADEGSPSLEGLVVQMADTPSDHAALAEYFRGKAEKARRAAKRHEGMARTYGAGKLTERVQMSSHCKRLASTQNAIADEYEALAKLHDQQAKNPQ